MQRIIDNPFSKGLQAKIYWSLYCKPQTGYEVAKTVYGVKKNPRTSKIYPNLKLLAIAGYVKRDQNKKYQIVIERLVSHIEKTFRKQNISLNGSERECIKTILESETCRKEIETMFYRIDFGKIPPNEEDFFSLVTSYLSTLFSTMRFSQKRKIFLPFSNFVRYINKINSQSKLKPIDPDDIVKFLISNHDKMLEHTDSKIFDEIIKQRWNETMEFLKEGNYSIKEQKLDKKIMRVHLIFDLLMMGLPLSVLDKMSKLNPQIPHMMESSYLAMKYAMRENLH